mmetsp:Transcript_5230/g.6873  ORF Transcript_5230/g.6873 Transcript_5230/m.6873 type:complete len:205 (-) Transcript_5230:1226-1840(-)
MREVAAFAGNAPAFGRESPAFFRFRLARSFRIVEDEVLVLEDLYFKPPVVTFVEGFDLLPAPELLLAGLGLFVGALGLLLLDFEIFAGATLGLLSVTDFVALGATGLRLPLEPELFAATFLWSVAPETICFEGLEAAFCCAWFLTACTLASCSALFCSSLILGACSAFFCSALILASSAACFTLSCSSTTLLAAVTAAGSWISQ